MPATFTCASVRPNNGIQQVHLTLNEGQPNHVYLNVTADVLRKIFDADVQGGDVWALRGVLISRAGTNGTKRG